MKKTFFILGLTVLAGAVVAHCGGDSTSGSSDPTAAKSAFTNPDGTITSDNATTVMNEALSSSAANGNALQGLPGVPAGLGKLALENTLRTFNPNFRAQGNVDNCVTGNETSATIDLGCISDLGEVGDGCTASGTMTFSTDGALFTVDINNVSFQCVGTDDDVDVSGWNGQMIFLFDQSLQDATGIPTLLIFCADISATIDGVAESFTGCVGGPESEYAGMFVIDGEGGSVVCNGIKTNDDCSKGCANFTTSEGNVKIECDTTLASGATCGDWTDLDNPTNCTVSAGTCGTEYTK